ncbi:UNVERIFIED_CONTAM: hypothetical protein Cloal_4255 [Acetivibrio alkalicellulosi]
MDIISDISKFSRIFLYRILYKNRVFAGVFSLIWGFFAIGNSITGLNDSFLNLILFPIGVLLIIEGVWRIVSPKPLILLFEGIVFAFLGAWNIIISLLNITFGDLGFFFIMIGFFQVYWAVQDFKIYKKFCSKNIEKPTDDEINAMDQIINSIIKANMKLENDIIRLQVKSFVDQIWKARLYPDKIIILIGLGSDFHIANKEDFQLIEQKMTILPKGFKVSINLNGKAYFGQISEEHFSRFKHWKNNELSQNQN